jgi:trehalose 6-phosphate synthase
LSRLVVVSNRVAPIDEGQAAAGGLAVGVLAALKETGGLWFGWNGEIVPTQPAKPDLQKVGPLTYATVGMTRRDYNEYYTNFANATLWPLFHYRLDLTRFDQRSFNGYLRVNSRFARLLQPLLRVDDFLWVHDYHLIPLAAELRRMGADHPIGFFLHTPLPAVEILLALPRHEAMMRALCAYDLIGFQTVNDLSAFYDYIVLEAGGEVLADGVVRAFGRTLRAGVFPIGVEVDNIVTIAAKHDNSPTAKRLRQVQHGRELIIGVDRLDYSKGLTERFHAFEAMLEANPEMQGKVALMQVAPPSRGDVGGYNEIRRELETAAGHINGRFADFDWVPIRYLNKSFDRDELTCFYRHSRVGLVTPLRDGMNLVAKEFVASQNEADPGALVLSRFAGAAHELVDALIVNPHDTGEVADAIHRGLTMPLRERRARWRSMMAQLRRHDVHSWRNDFLNALERMPNGE